ncbi:hypothetical protein [Shewanella sp. UCD-KL21]|uniref:hypothetical protein n=1 Tax=Shewanella sp. UCD-KL21 TaxID=1917164 RepID=UPI0011154FC0|nr:hypothetical protein [Shewanella sp. UCD-KL21]
MPDAIYKLFGISVATESIFLKNKANSFVRNQLIQTVREEGVQRAKVYIKDLSQLDVLHNALLLDAIFSDTQVVKRIFDDRGYRNECSKTIEKLLCGNNNISGIALQSNQVQIFIDTFASDVDLYKTRLPNPFSTLPQVALGDNTGILHALLINSSTLTSTDSILMAYLQRDFIKAKQLCEYLDDSVLGIKALKQSIEIELQQANEFDDLLDQMKKM